MRALILGMPGSGTSYFAGILSALGWSDAPPTFSAARYRYPTHESLLGRSVNRIALGSNGPARWPIDRWHAHYHPRSTMRDSECRALARYFVSLNDRLGQDWYFKNPETVMFFPSVWAEFSWDEVIGVYRHPEESVKTIHSFEGLARRRRSWLRWTRRILECSTVLVRFPDDGPSLCDAIGREMPRTFKTPKGLPRNRATDPPRDWAKGLWNEMESYRWSSTTC